MKDLKQYVESQLYDSSLTIESLLDDEDEVATDFTDIIRNFLKYYYKIDDPISIYKDDGQWYVDVLGSVEIKQDHMDRLTNGFFRFGWVNGTFNCEYSLIRSLEGAPKKCKVLMCNHCDRLKNLVGGPEECTKIYCDHCKTLRSLKGAPKECNKIFYKGSPIRDFGDAPRGCKIINNDTFYI